MRTVTAQEMAEIDRRAQEDYGIPQKVLMESAGRSVSDVILSENQPFNTQRVVILCGKGNNGGDGFVVARYLLAAFPREITVVAPDKKNIRPGAALDNYNAAAGTGLDIRSYPQFLSSGNSGEFDIAVDAVFGTGFNGEISEDYSKVIDLAASASKKLYAVDIPSGLDATTGVAAKNCPKVYKTITFGLPKKGFYLKDGPRVTGDITVQDIGFPKDLLQNQG